jgi:hypothetical protein
VNGIVPLVTPPTVTRPIVTPFNDEEFDLAQDQNQQPLIVPSVKNKAAEAHEKAKKKKKNTRTDQVQQVQPQQGNGRVVKLQDPIPIRD